MDRQAEEWYCRRTSRWLDWPVDQLLERKQRDGIQVSVVIPARNEARTVAGVVGPIVRGLLSETHLVDEVVVIVDDHEIPTGSAVAIT